MRVDIENATICVGSFLEWGGGGGGGGSGASELENIQIFTIEKVNNGV